MAEMHIRILIIAPYDGLKNTAELAAEAFPDLRVDVYTGDLHEGAELFRNIEDHSYDAVISRGGTAAMIREQSEIPVVEIRISVYDVLRTMRMADNYTDSYAIVGFANFTEVAHAVSYMLHRQPEIITISSSEEAERAMLSLKDRGCRTVLCDNIAHTSARELGMNAFLITSGQEALYDALTRAAELGAIYRRLRNENVLLHSFLSHHNSSYVMLDHYGKPIYSIPKEIPKDLPDLLRSHMSELSRTSGEMRFFHNRHGTLYAIIGRRTVYDNEAVYIFSYLPTQIPLRTSRPGIRSIGRTECEHLFTNSFFAVSGSMGALDGRITSLAHSRQGIMIIGEVGTGKHQVAHALYLRGPLSRNPFVVIDCTLLNSRTWTFLLTHEASPLNSSDMTLCFHHAEALSDTQANELLSVINDTALLRRERILFSCECREDEPIPEIANRFITRLGLIPLRLPTLRSRSDELSSLALLYLGSVNSDRNTQIMGFEPGAMKQLERYDWPGNYTQFKQVVQELATLTDNTYIRTESVAEVLATQRGLTRRIAASSEPSAFHGTLEEITREAITRALHENHGNQSAAARQLGIGRTTMWRYLGRPKE